jgi:hypothetical protein
MAISYELDHVFILTDAGAPEAELLISFGLSEGSPNTHAGQGTANRRFFFHNAMIELLFVCDVAEAVSEVVRRSALLQRWQKRRTTASPFGICLRPGPASPQRPPFSAWEYHPPYFASPIYLGTNSLRVVDPLLFYLPFGNRPDGQKQPLKHEAGFQEITGVRVKGPTMDRLPAEMEELRKTGLVDFILDEIPLMELGFDRELAGESHEFGPALPLRFCW